MRAQGLGLGLGLGVRVRVRLGIGFICTRYLAQTTSAYNLVQSTFYEVSCLLHARQEFSLK